MMNRGWLLSSLFLVFSCSTLKGFNWTVREVINNPGKITQLEIALPQKLQPKELVCDGKSYPFKVEAKSLKTYLAESYFSKRRQYTCEISYREKGALKKRVIAKVNVEPYQYPSERLNVDKKRVFLSKKDLRRVRKERKILNKIYAKSSGLPLFDQSFKSPMDSYITSYYGTRRVFNNQKSSQHLGTDFRAAIGVDVPVSNSGKVVFVGDLFYSGKTIIVDHGLGIFTVYGHLSAFDSELNKTVEKGEIIGKSGMTGRVTGPHLHWGVKVHGHWVDGLALVSLGS